MSHSDWEYTPNTSHYLVFQSTISQSLVFCTGLTMMKYLMYLFMAALVYSKSEWSPWHPGVVQQDGLKYHWDSNTPVQAFLQESSARFELTCWKTAESCMFHSAANSWKRWQWWKYFRFTRCALLLYHSPQLISWWRGVYWDSCCLSRLIGETFKVVTGFQEGVQSKNPKRVEESRNTLHTAFKGSVEAFRSCTAICEEHSP